MSDNLAPNTQIYQIPVSLAVRLPVTVNSSSEGKESNNKDTDAADELNEICPREERVLSDPDGDEGRNASNDVQEATKCVEMVATTNDHVVDTTITTDNVEDTEISSALTPAARVPKKISMAYRGARDIDIDNFTPEKFNPSGLAILNTPAGTPQPAGRRQSLGSLADCFNRIIRLDSAGSDKVDPDDAFSEGNETPNREYDICAPGIASSYGLVDNIEPIVVPNKESSDTLEFLVVDEDNNEDPENELCIVERVDSLEYESENECETKDEVFEEVVSYLDDPAKEIFASVVLKSCADLVYNEDLHWGYANKVEDYIASFWVSQFGIRLVDLGLSVIETPVSSFSTWMSDGVRHTRRHLRATRRAGEKQNGNSCIAAKSFLLRMATLFPVNAVLDNMGAALVETNELVKETNLVDGDNEDPDYVLSSDESEDNLEFRSEFESEEETGGTEFESYESSDGDEEVDFVESSDE